MTKFANRPLLNSRIVDYLLINGILIIILNMI